jgi:hypothetical protein
MANVAVGFQLTANAAGMAQGINAGVVELQKLGLAAKQTAGDVRVLTGLQLGTAFVSAVRAVATSFTSFTAGASASIDATNKLSRSLGISFGELQRLQLAADLSGASSETLAQAFTKAQVTITKASKGGREATASLRALGLSVGELSSLSASDQFDRIAAAIAAIDNPAQRAAAAVSIFGDSGAKLLPTFQELASNLQRAEGFFAGFKSQLTGDDAKRVEDINDAFTEVQKAVQQTAGIILSRLQPALTTGAATVRTFIQTLDVDAVAGKAASALGDLARVAEALASILGPAIQRPIIAIGVGLAFINRQAIATGVASLASTFTAAATAAGGYSIAMGTATVATNVFKASLRGLAAATVVGVIVVGLGLAAEAALQYGASGTSAADDVKKQITEMNDAIRSVAPELNKAGVAAQNFGAKVQAAVKIPNLSIGDIAQDSINQAQSAIAGLAKELGGTVNLPQELVSDFVAIQNLAERANSDLKNQNVLLGQLVEQSNRFADSVKQVTERRQADTRAAQEAAEATRRVAEDARKRTQDLAFEGLGGGEQSRIKLAQDLVAIDRERAAAEQALQAARKAGDADALAAARDRLRLVGEAAKTAREQDRQRQLQALGIDNSLLKPAQTIATQFEALRGAIRQGLLNPDEINAAVQNIAKEAIDARKEIARELSRPSQQSLRVADIRSSEGISQFFATGREDPAVGQRREQLARLVEIRRELQNLRAMNVEIRG